MVEESAAVRDQIRWFTTLVSKVSSLPDVYEALDQVRAAEVLTVELEHGQKKSRVVAWTFKAP